MEGLDVLGADSFEDLLVGAAVPDASPVLSKLAAASRRASAAAAKLQKRSKNPRVVQAAAKLRSHASAATTKGQKLKRALDKAKTKAASTLAKPQAAPAVKAAAKAVQQAPAARPVAGPARGAVRPSRKGVSVLGISQALLASVTDWVRPMMDVYSKFAAAVDDASAAAEVIAQVQPLLDQISASNPSSPLVATGNGIVALANEIINSVQYPPDPPLDAQGGTVPGASVGRWFALVGEISDAGADLQRQAIDWIKAARDAVAIAAQAAPPAVVPVPVPVPPPIAPMPPSNQFTPGGGGSGGGGGGGADEGAPPDEGVPPGGDEGVPSDEEETPTDDYGAPPDDYGQGVQPDFDGMPSDEQYTSDEDQGDQEESEDTMSDDEGESVFELLGKGGGGHGGGHHGGGHHGGHHGGGRRGMRGGWGGWYGGPWYDGPWYDSGYDILIDDDDEELADKIAKKVAQRQWAAGQHSHVGYVAPEKSWFVTPGAIKTEMDKIVREVETLANDISKYKGSDPAFASFKSGWTDFSVGYKKFYVDNAEGVGGWLSRLWGSIGDQTVSYGNQVNDWRERYKRFAGASVTEPSVTSIVRRDDPTATNWKPYAIAGGVVAGLGVVGYAIGKVVSVVAKRR